jgi:C4-dicarboxylate-specific signal transduction histidine kinase
MQLLICITDISAQKLSERNLHLQQSRMATIEKSRSMNEQVYSISNHQNHSLTLINNYIYGCIRRIETEKFDSDELLQSLKKVALQSRTLSDIIVQMKQFTGKSVLRYGLVDINTVINEVLSLIYLETIEFPIAIQYVPINQPLLLKLDKLHIQHVILNLARNSIEAMRDAKTLEPKLYIEVRLVNSHEITINVLDNGPGFDMLACEKLFEPHFTTKAYAFGLGLSVARSIIEKHNGELIAQKNAPSGACFQITLPRSLQSEDVAASI